MAESNRRAELFEWMRFCKEKIEPIDKIWTKRLEDKGSDSEEEKEDEVHVVQPTVIDGSSEEEIQIASILDRVRSRSNPGMKLKSSEAAKIRNEL